MKIREYRVIRNRDGNYRVQSKRWFFFWLTENEYGYEASVWPREFQSLRAAKEWIERTIQSNIDESKPDDWKVVWPEPTNETPPCRP